MHLNLNKKNPYILNADDLYKVTNAASNMADFKQQKKVRKVNE